MVQLNPHMTLLKNDNIIHSLGWLLQKRVQLSPNLFWSTFPIVTEELLGVVVLVIQSCPTLWDPIEENAKVDPNRYWAGFFGGRDYKPKDVRNKDTIRW